MDWILLQSDSRYDLKWNFELVFGSTTQIECMLRIKSQYYGAGFRRHAAAAA